MAYYPDDEDEEFDDDESLMAELGTDDEADVPDLSEDVEGSSDEDGGVEVPNVGRYSVAENVPAEEFRARSQAESGNRSPAYQRLLTGTPILEESPAPQLAQGYAPVRTLRQNYPGQVPMGQQQRPRMTAEQEILYLARGGHRGAQAAYLGLKRQEAALGMQERMRLSRLQNQLGVIEQADWLSPQEKLNAAFLLQTKIDPLKMREEAEIRRSRNEALQTRTMQMGAMLRDSAAVVGMQKKTAWQLPDGTWIVNDLQGTPRAFKQENDVAEAIKRYDAAVKRLKANSLTGEEPSADAIEKEMRKEMEVISRFEHSRQRPQENVSPDQADKLPVEQQRQVAAQSILDKIRASNPGKKFSDFPPAVQQRLMQLREMGAQ